MSTLTFTLASLATAAAGLLAAAAVYAEPIGLRTSPSPMPAFSGFSYTGTRSCLGR